MRNAILIFSMAAAALALSEFTEAQAQQQQAANGASVEVGKGVYDQYCTACHGAKGGAGDRAPAIVMSDATAMRGAPRDAELLAIIRNGVPGTAMPAWGSQLSDDDITRLGAYISALRGTALDNPWPGDVVHGGEVFWGKGGCGGCHAIAGRGNVAGPDLTNIAAIRKATAIEDALTKTEHRVYGDGGVHLPMIPPMDYDPVHVVTKHGQALDGLMRNQDAWSVQFVTMDGILHSFDRSELRSLDIKPGSVMPTDYDKRLAPDEFKDLMAFLTLQGTKVPLSRRGE